jgi:hypothetical protein
MSIIQVSVSSLSTSLGHLSNISISSFSTLSTAIGLTSNYLPFFSTISTIIFSSFSTTLNTIQSGFSTLSTAIEFFTENYISTFLILNTSSLSTGYIKSHFINTSSFSTTTGFFQSFQGSTMSSLTQNVGRMNTTQMIASSFSGNYADSLTIVIQYV